ncbi:MAG TPA: hypothetical protein VHV08_08695 [Pirellulales bacterium]|jgi:hypothetical protein|nr:hypothetical protein [Pirellulales bacterium]
MVNPRIWLLTFASLAAAAIAGCKRQDGIEHYVVLKPPPMEAPAAASGATQVPLGEPRDRTLAAIVPVGSQGWFFKLTGPKDAVASHEQQFNSFLETVHFPADGKPQWKLPAGWQERPGSDIRYATLVLPGVGEQPTAKPLEVSVTRLPKGSGDDEGYVLVNVNRWRSQLMLPPIDKQQLVDQSRQVQLEGAMATVVNLVGIATAGGMGGGPFSPGAADSFSPRDGNGK